MPDAQRAVAAGTSSRLTRTSRRSTRKPTPCSAHTTRIRSDRGSTSRRPEGRFALRLLSPTCRIFWSCRRSMRSFRALDSGVGNGSDPGRAAGASLAIHPTLLDSLSSLPGDRETSRHSELAFDWKIALNTATRPMGALSGGSFNIVLFHNTTGNTRRSQCCSPYPPPMCCEVIPRVGDSSVLCATGPGSAQAGK